MKIVKHVSAVALCSMGMLSTNLMAAPIGYTDHAAFVSAIGGMNSSTETFDDYVATTTIASGSSLDGTTFSYDFGANENLMVTDAYFTTSGNNSLGSDLGNDISDGETEFRLDFAHSNAVGMFFITADFLDDADISLNVGAFSVELSLADIYTILPDFSEVFFLGIVDMDATFNSIEISTATDDLFHYNIDDIVIATGNTSGANGVPMPAPLLLIVPMLWGITRNRHPQIKQRPQNDRQNRAPESDTHILTPRQNRTPPY